MHASLSYTDSGSGIPLVFLHGFCETKAVWSDVIEGLSEKYRIIAIDTPGFGESASIEHYSMEGLAERLHQFLADMGIQKCVLTGHSMGGYIALAFAEKYPRSLYGLCLFHSTAFADSVEKKEMRDKTIRYLIENGVEAFIRPFVPPLFFSKNRRRLEAKINETIELGIRFGNVSNIVKAVEAMRDRPDRSHVLTEAAFPVLFIVGKNDTSVPLDASMQMVQLPQLAQVLLLGDTAHMGMFEKPMETRAALEGFMKWIEISHV